jgi:hypothetical protein
MDIPMLAHASETEGVGGWVHPVLYFPWNPVVLVEGSIDVTIFEHVARVVGLGHIRFVSLPDIDQTAKRGGKDAITQFLKTAKVFIRNRGKGCPFLVLADWDVSDQEMAKMRAAYGNEADRYVLRMDPELADPVMSEDFRGIERFYPPKVLYDADAAGELILGIKDGKPLSVSASQLQQAKGALSGRLRRVDEPELLKPLIQNLLLVTDAVNAESPLQLKLKV